MLNTLSEPFEAQVSNDHFRARTGASKSVLIMEDDAILGCALLEEFEEAGYAATHCVDAQFMSERPSITEQLIVLDVNLLDSDAIDVLRILDAKRYQGTIQLVSGSPSDVLEGVRRFGQESGLHMHPVIRKPTTPKDIRALAEQRACAIPSQPSLPSTSAQTSMASAETGAKPSAVNLGAALRKNWVEIWYQPKYSIKTGQIVGAECLSRVRHPRAGILPPSAFLPKASEADLMTLTELVLRQACADWQDFGNLGHPLKLAINVPGPLLIKLPLVRLLRNHAPKCETWPGLTLEMTEEEALHDIDAARNISTQLQIYKVCLSIDDFGIGYSGFARLCDIPFKEIKLDRSLVDRCADDPLRGALCRTIVELAHSFGAEAVAEGVERQRDLDYLRSINCDFAQGYLCARPMPKEQLLGLMQIGATCLPEPDTAHDGV